MRPWLIVLPIAAVAIAFASALGNGFTNWDDPSYLLYNDLTVDPLGHGLRGLLLTEELRYPIPVTVLVYAVERAWFGLDPAAFHAVSIGLHAICVVLAALLARQLGASWPGAAAGAVLFALHPLVVEPVAWVVGQKDLLAAMFVLAALCVRASRRGESWPAAIATGVLTALAIGAKPSAVAAPVLLAALDWTLERKLLSPQAIALYGVTLAVAVAATLLSLSGHGGEPIDRMSLAKLGESAWAVGLQARHLVWPMPLLARYFPPDGAALTAGIVLGLAGLGIAIEGVVFTARRGHRAAAFAIAAALLAYLPVSGLLPLTRGPADSYLYLPLALSVIGLARAVGWATRRTPLAWGLLAVIAGVLGYASYAQTAMWRDAPALWRPVAEHHPDEPRAVMRLGDAYLFVDQPHKALAVYEQLARQFPTFATSTLAHGQTLETLGRAREAEVVFAAGAEHGDEPVYRERYALFLIGHPEIEPTRPEQARAALVQLAPDLAARGKREPSLARAAELLDRYRQPDLAAAMRRRIEQLRERTR